MRKILIRPIAILACLVVSLPLLLAGTFDPCKASGILLFSKINPQNPIEASIKFGGVEMAANSVKQRGILACYGTMFDLATSDKNKIKPN